MILRPPGWKLIAGGMVLSGDDITKMSPEKINLLKNLLPLTGVSAEFEDFSFQIGKIELKDKLIVCLFKDIHS